MKRIFRVTAGYISTKLIVAFMFLVPLPTGKVEAHHGFEGRYDASSPLYLEGTVQETRWEFPHSTILLKISTNVQTPQNLRQLTQLNNSEEIFRNLIVPQNLLGRTQQLELPPVSIMVTPLRRRLRLGDRISVIVYRNCVPPNQLRVQFARLQDGTTVSRPGTVQTEINGCNSRRKK
ncbi:hypothetical protein A6S26_07485 [Nostoc sp. ATCC 43529]|nr:hypothetical protein A6S26_07485 [Nostoc sp. ATCC 43529]